MSSPSPPGSNGSSGSNLKVPNASKKKRRPGACDSCKKKKFRCDSAEMLGNRCTNCIQFSLDCTHREVSKTLGSAKGYVESLEIRLEKMERLLYKLNPGADLNHELDNLEGGETPAEVSELPRNDDDVQEGDLVGRIKKLNVDPPQGREYFGKSSGYQLLQTAIDIKMDYVGGNYSLSEQTAIFQGCKRPEFWISSPWLASLNDIGTSGSYTFPPDDLMPHLIDAYFTRINCFLPLLHRPTFEKSLIEGLHHRDHAFGGTLLFVCALGSKYSEDPRTFYPGSDSPRSAGWRWAEQVKVQRSFVSATSLTELQNYALYIMVMQSTSSSHVCWVLLGIALRRAQEVGAHRRRPLKFPTTEDELWKRAFWVLMCLDQLLSSWSGRQCLIQEEGYDVELPIECDDEYWDHPDPASRLKQPEGTPSTITFFNCYIKLMGILSYAMRVVYSVRKPQGIVEKETRSSGQQIIMELDSTMNNWMDSVPDHLRWDPNCANKLFHNQSAILYAIYYYVQIFIHRPFIPSFRNPSPTAFPSLAICTNAARSCCHVLSSQSIGNEIPLSSVKMAIFTSAVVLLVNIWSGKRSGHAPHPQREMADVQKCMDLFRTRELRWTTAGRFCDVLMGLASAGNLPFPADPTSSVQQPRDAGSWSTGQSNSGQASVTTGPLSKDQFSGNVPLSEPIQFALPMYGNELGKLPVYGQINFLEESLKRPRRESDSTPVDNSHLRPGADPTNSGFGTTVNNSTPDFMDTAGSYMSNASSSLRQMPDWDTQGNLGGGIHNATLADLLNGSNEMPNFPESWLMDQDILAMWTAPGGFELNEWGTYI